MEGGQNGVIGRQDVRSHATGEREYGRGFAQIHAQDFKVHIAMGTLVRR